MARRNLFFALSALVLAAGLAAWMLWPRIHPGFVDAFRDATRGSDDAIVDMKFDAATRTLLLGRESGTVELWDATRTDGRTIIQAHRYRAEKLCFGVHDSIVFSNGLDDTTRIWDARTGELRHQIPDTRGPIATSPISGIYLVAGGERALTLFDYRKRAVLDASADIEGSVTAMISDPASRLIAVGTSLGGIEVLRLAGQDDGLLRLEPLTRSKPYATGDWIQAVALLDDGRRLFSVSRSGEVAEWDPSTLAKRRVFPSTLRHIYRAAFLPGEPWLVTSGTMESTGLRSGKVEVIDLTAGIATRYKANTNLPVGVLLPPISVGLIAQSGSTKAIRFPDTAHHAPAAPLP